MARMPSTSKPDERRPPAAVFAVMTGEMYVSAELYASGLARGNDSAGFSVV